MERPWLMLGRVVLVDPDADELAAAQAQAQHPAVAEAGDEIDAQADDEEQAVAGEAAVHAAVAAVAAAMVEVQDEQQAAAADAQAAEAQEEDPVQADLEVSVEGTNPNIAESEAAHAARGAAAEPDFTVAVAPPPLVSSLAAALGAHPDPERPDMYPYIVATGSFCLLVHFAVAPSHGTVIGQAPEHGRLVVVRHFRRAGDGHVEACAVHVPDRPADADAGAGDAFPALRNIDSVGLVCDWHTGHYKIAELIVTTGAPEAEVVFISTDTGVWYSISHENPLPLATSNRRDWVPHGTVTVDTTVCWFDLSWGVIACDLGQPHELQFLVFHRLPAGRVLRGPMPDIHGRRCIAVSEKMLRYVEIIVLHPPEAGTVKMWYRDLEAEQWRWIVNYCVSFEDIWADASYAQTGLPRNNPMLAGVSPVDCSVVYFTLEHRLFGVDLLERRVVHCEIYDPLNMPGPEDEPVTSRYLITWDLLDTDQEPNGGYETDHSNYADDSTGPWDEGEIDYEEPNAGHVVDGPADEGEIDYMEIR